MRQPKVEVRVPALGRRYSLRSPTTHEPGLKPRLNEFANVRPHPWQQPVISSNHSRDHNARILDLWAIQNTSGGL